eukprot:NODE_360_length_907_cov_437.460256_g352_i0.p1 GENE.NODE_360_length_907_cov_437.460256_g352_i0~~NODE_360_length_907_cov_437.460256_g352_i0.p1  ORF type:complete len:194 (+),score=38.49 NODE_360_length_907_cov_437.460256_g352_i0:73-582(+)
MSVIAGVTPTPIVYSAANPYNPLGVTTPRHGRISPSVVSVRSAAMRSSSVPIRRGRAPSVVSAAPIAPVPLRGRSPSVVSAAPPMVLVRAPSVGRAPSVVSATPSMISSGALSPRGIVPAQPVAVPVRGRSKSVRPAMVAYGPKYDRRIGFNGRKGGAPKAKNKIKASI